MEIDVTPVTRPQNGPDTPGDIAIGAQVTTNSQKELSHSKKVIKHALRQQAKRRRKNTTIAAGNPVPRIIVKPIAPPSDEPPQIPVITPQKPVVQQKTPTMREVLASIPGFSMKPRKRSNKKMSTAAQLEQTKEGCIDIETPDSILVNTNLRGLLNKYTFSALPPLYQSKLVQLLPSVDRQMLTNTTDTIKLNNSGLTNEFFARACLEWQERLSEGEFTPENQQKLRTEADKERSRLDPWKLKHFEPIWGDRSMVEASDGTTVAPVNTRPPIKTTIKLRQTTSNKTAPKPAPPVVKRIRTVGAMTRSCTTYKEELQATQVVPETPVVEVNTQIPDLLPLKSNKNYVNDDTCKDECTTIDDSSSKTSEAVIEHEMSESVEAEEIKEVEEEMETCSDNVNTTMEDLTIINNITSSVVSNSIPKVSEKRRRSPSSETEQRSPKRFSPNRELPEKTDSPTDQLELTETDNSEEKSETTNVETISDLQTDTDSIKSLAPEEDVAESSNKDIPNTSVEKELENDQEISIMAPTDFESVSIELSIDAPSLDDEHRSTEESGSEKPMVESEEDHSIGIDYEATIKNDAFNAIDFDLGLDRDLKIDLNVLKDKEESSESQNQEMPDMSFVEETELRQPVLESLHLKHDLAESFQMLPNTLILQQESMVLDKSCPQNCENVNCIEEDSAEKLEASVEESDLVLLKQEGFEGVRNLTDDDVNDDRFIDAENYVLEESGQMSVSTSQKAKEDPPDIRATLFGGAVPTGKINNSIDLLCKII